MQLLGAVFTVAESKQKTDEDSKAGGRLLANDVYKV